MAGYGTGTYGTGTYGTGSPTVVKTLRPLPALIPARPPAAIDAHPFRIAVHDRTGGIVGYLGDPKDLPLRPRHNAITTCELTVANDHRLCEALLDEGAWVAVTFEGETYTGPVRRLSGDGPAIGGSITFGMDGDFRLLGRILGWPVPSAPLTAQTSEFAIYSGPAETVALAIIKDNAERAGIPVTVPASLGRGANIRVNARMEALADLLLPAIDEAGIGLNVTRVANRYAISVYEPRLFPHTLTESNGVVGWEISREAPTATRVVVGGGGDGVAREFVQFIDTAREAKWGDVVEVFVDADDAASDYTSAKEALATAKSDLTEKRLASLEDPADTSKAAEVVAARSAVTSALLVAEARRQEYRAELARRGAEALAEGLPRVGVKVTLSATEHFTYGGPNGLRVGDRIRLEIGPGLVVDEVLREVEINWSADNGLTVAPVVGEVTDSTDKRLYRAVRTLASALRALRARR